MTNLPTNTRIRTFPTKTIDQVCELVAQGSLLQNACDIAGISVSTFKDQIKTNELVNIKYENAKENLMQNLKDKKLAYSNRAIDKLANIIELETEGWNINAQVSAADKLLKVGGMMGPDTAVQVNNIIPSLPSLDDL